MKTNQEILEEARIEQLRIECGFCHAPHAKVYETIFDCAIYKEIMAK